MTHNRPPTPIKPVPPANYVGVSIVLGAALGAVVGLAVENLVAMLSSGVAIGLGCGVILNALRR